MSATALKRVAIALVIVLVLWGASELLTSRSDEVESVAVIPALAADGVDSLMFVRDSDTVRLVRQGTSWRVNAFPASSSAVAELFSNIGGGVQARLIARSASSHARLGVDSGGARLLGFRGADTNVDLVIGKRGQGYQTRYVRPSEQEATYELTGALASILDHSVTEWRDKRILAVMPARVGRIAVERAGGGYTLVRHDSVWTLEGGGTADSATVASMLEGFSSLEAQAGSPFATAEEADSIDFSRPDRRITLMGVAGDTLARLEFDSTAGGFWVRHVGGETIYKLPIWKMNEIAPSDSTLRQADTSGS